MTRERAYTCKIFQSGRLVGICPDSHDMAAFDSTESCRIQQPQHPAWLHTSIASHPAAKSTSLTHSSVTLAVFDSVKLRPKATSSAGAILGKSPTLNLVVPKCIPSCRAPLAMAACTFVLRGLVLPLDQVGLSSR